MSQLCFILLFCLNLNLHDMSGYHEHYKFNKPARQLNDSLMSLLKSKYSYQQLQDSTEIDNLTGLERYSQYILYILPEKKENHISTELFIIVYRIDQENSELVFFESVYIGKRIWAWNLHRPYALLYFPVEYERRDDNFPFADDEKAEKDKILKSLGYKDDSEH